MDSTRRPAPARQSFLLLILAIFVTEYLIMNLPALRGTDHGRFVRALMDASLLSALLLPVTFFFIYIPKRRNFENLEQSKRGHIDLEERYQQLAKGVSVLANNVHQFSGKPFFEATCQYLTEDLSADSAFIGRLNERTGEVQMLAGYAAGRPIRSFNFYLEDEPCEEMHKLGIPLLSKDQWLERINNEAITNTPARNRDGKPLGFLTILKSQSPSRTNHFPQIKEALTNRIAAELEQIETSERLDRSHILYRDLFASIRDTIIITDQEGAIIDANQPALRDMFGYELEDIAGQSARIIYADGSDFNAAEEQLFGRPENIGGIPANLSCRRKNGNSFPVEAHALTLESEENEATGNIVVIRDISKRVQTEDENLILERLLQQSQKMEAVGKLAGGVAHDFNNMLQVVVGYGEALAMKLADDEQLRSFAENILLAAEKSTQMTRSLLAFSRKQHMSLKPTELNQLIQGFGGFINRVLSAEISFRFEHFSEELYVMADAHQLEQVFMNLATNARDSMPDGGEFCISISRTHLDEDTLQRYGHEKAGYFARIEFNDTGHGISEENLDQVFDPFFTTKEEGSGTGLGLAMSFGIVSQHKGMLHAESRPGEGASFYIDLPLIPARKLHAEKAFNLDGVDAGTETILLAEDRPDVSSAIASTLEQFGYTVVVASDGYQALELFNATPDRFDLLLLDVSMPGHSGPKIFDQVKSGRPDLKAVFLSGYASEALEQHDLDVTGVDLLNKPVQAKVLLEKVRAILDS